MRFFRIAGMPIRFIMVLILAAFSIPMLLIAPQGGFIGFTIPEIKELMVTWVWKGILE